jgi:hypothetical protein
MLSKGKLSLATITMRAFGTVIAGAATAEPDGHSNRMICRLSVKDNNLLQDIPMIHPKRPLHEISGSFPLTRAIMGTRSLVGSL